MRIGLRLARGRRGLRRRRQLGRRRGGPAGDGGARRTRGRRRRRGPRRRRRPPAPGDRDVLADDLVGDVRLLLLQQRLLVLLLAAGCRPRRRGRCRRRRSRPASRRARVAARRLPESAVPAGGRRGRGAGAVRAASGGRSVRAVGVAGGATRRQARRQRLGGRGGRQRRRTAGPRPGACASATTRRWWPPRPPTRPATSQRRRPLGSGDRRRQQRAVRCRCRDRGPAIWAGRVSASNIDGALQRLRRPDHRRGGVPLGRLTAAASRPPVSDASNTMSSSRSASPRVGRRASRRRCRLMGGAWSFWPSSSSQRAQLGLAGGPEDAALGGLEIEQHLLAGLVAIGRVAVFIARSMMSGDLRAAGRA